MCKLEENGDHSWYAEWLCCCFENTKLDVAIKGMSYIEIYRIGYQEKGTLLQNLVREWKYLSK